MKKVTGIILLGLCLVMPFTAYADPHLTCDPQVGIDSYQITIDGVTATSPALTGGVMSYDLASIAVGTHTVTAKACQALWGCSDASVPFTFVRPALSAPTKFILGK